MPKKPIALDNFIMAPKLKLINPNQRITQPRSREQFCLCRIHFNYKANDSYLASDAQSIYDHRAPAEMNRA